MIINIRVRIKMGLEIFRDIFSRCLLVLFLLFAFLCTTLLEVLFIKLICLIDGLHYSILSALSCAYIMRIKKLFRPAHVITVQ